MTFPWRRRLLLPAMLAAILTAPASAQAHAILVESQPAIGATVPAGTVALRMRYNSRIDRARSRLLLTRPDKSQSVLPIEQSGFDDTLTSVVALTPGAYVVRWQVLAIDGHITHGNVPFIVIGP